LALKGLAGWHTPTDQLAVLLMVTSQKESFFIGQLI